MIKKSLFLVLLVSVLVFPLSVLAAVDSIQSLMTVLVNKVVWAVFFAIVVVCFIRSAILFLSSGGQPDNIAKAKSSFIWGVAGVVVGIVAYSIINIVTKLLS